MRLYVLTTKVPLVFKATNTWPPSIPVPFGLIPHPIQPSDLAGAAKKAMDREELEAL
uniref:Uncharacterized protein n=1 Tax=Rhizophora mucronata TaxID=61149 RepID=A0A2P2QQP2_RHIMU